MLYPLKNAKIYHSGEKSWGRDAEVGVRALDNLTLGLP